MTTDIRTGVRREHLAAARAFFPDPEQWDVLRPLIERLDLPTLSAVPEPEPWRAVPLGEAALAAADAVSASSPFATTIARLFSVELDEVDRAVTAAGRRARGITRGAREEVLTALLDRLTGTWIRVLVADMHDRSERGLLDGATPEDRFESFRRTSRHDDYLADIARTYPSLMRSSRAVLSGRAAQVHDVAEALARADDVGLPPGDVTRLGFGAGDSHQGGRSVCIIELAGGARVVFKPRSLDIEVAFYDIAEHLLAQCGEHLPRPWIRSFERYGLMENVLTTLPESSDGYRRYFTNLGRMSAILHLLGGHDMHHENVIASREMPLPIDLECLFHGRVARDEGPPSATSMITAELADSVVASMILPSAIQVGEVVFQIGAGAMVGEQLSPLKSFTVSNAGRDDMTITLERQTVSSDLSVPELVAAGLGVHEVMELVAAGVRSILTVARDEGDALVAMIRSRFAGTRARFLNAPSLAYAQLLRMLTHPSLARDPVQSAAAASRALVFSETNATPMLHAEVQDLLVGDLPFFTFDPRGTAIESWDGHVAPDAFVAPPLDDVAARVAAIDDPEIERQADLARMSFVSQLDDTVEPTGFALGQAQATPRGDVVARIAHEVADDLLAAMRPGVDADDVSNWLDIRISATGEGMWSPGSMDQFVYGGFTGVADFLCALGDVTGRSDCSRAGASVLEPLARQCVEHPDLIEPYPIGAASGLAGVAQSIVRHGEREDDADLRSAGAQILTRLGRRVETTEADDHLSGIAGLLAVCATIRDEHPGAVDQALLTDVASRCVAELVRRAESGAMISLGFSGFAHGISGVLPAVHRWQELPGAADLVDRMSETLDDFRDLEEGGWHTSNEHHGRAFGWCHGSPGILLGELLLVEAGRAPDEDRLRTALDLTVGECFGRSFGLCHGDLGTMEILRHARVVLGEEIMPSMDAESVEVVSSAAAVIASRRRPRGAYTRSLMVGRTGVGHAALRLLEPTAVPPVLWP